MTGVVESLASAGESAPVQRVRNYHLTDRAASPRPRDFLTAMRRASDLCLRWAGPAGNRFVRFADPGWECAEYDGVRGRKAVNELDVDRLREWLRESPPELVTYEEVRGAFEDAPVSASPEASVATDGGPGPDEPILVERYLDLLADPELDRRDADALADALPAGPEEVVVRLPLALAEETPLESVAGSDRVFVAESVADRGTERARYLRQGPRGALVPRHETRRYELAEDATVDRDESGPGATGSP
ncbi:hypothetical protein [Halorussus ruber]|uniref:hypothetical protein n=1 Tax=Halorussus ruber TaxID=1126238 RepID=UPI00109190E9|nr:hypothetical protein [Halorussus ruber]